MYKCTECGTEFDKKPDFCDCGNDTFEEIKPVVIEEPKPQTPKEKTVVPQNKERPVEKKPRDILSWAIFATCLMLSLIIIFFVGNPKEKIVEEVQKEQAVIANIPSIEKFWNNSTVGVKSDDVEVQPEEKPKPIQQFVQKVVAQTPKTPVSTQKPAAQKQKTQTNTQTTKPVQKPATQTNTSNQTKTTQPAAVNTTSKPQIPQNTLKEVNNQQAAKPVQNTQQVKPAQTTTPVQTSQVNTAAQKQELANYKISLRNTIGRKIDFTKVVGDGDCIVSFKVNSSGQLINRSFTKQSSNITLNDAVYQAMMSTPSFTKPPEIYNNETFSLNITFKNGNFAISLQ